MCSMIERTSGLPRKVSGRGPAAPFAENGAVRILAYSRYPNSVGSPAASAELVATLCDLNGHEFWPDDVSIFDSKRIDRARLLESSQVTDTNLLALAEGPRRKPGYIRSSSCD